MLRTDQIKLSSIMNQKGMHILRVRDDHTIHKYTVPD